jgi:two-component system sensor histidine kinase KdpD
MEKERMGWSRPGRARWVIGAFVPPAVVTLLAVPQDHPPTAAVAVLYVLSVVLSARVGGAVAGAVASAGSFLAFNFFFTEPLHTFAVGAPEDLVALFVFLVVAGVVGVLLSSALDARTRAERREVETRLVNKLTTRLLSGDQIDKVLTGLAEGLRTAFGFERCEVGTTLTEIAPAAGPPQTDEPIAIPAAVRGRAIGEIRVWTEGRRELGPEEQQILGSLAAQLALALEGTRLSDEVRRAELDAQASQLKAALFSGVTHDVKTPLAAIMAAVTSLMDGHGFTEVDRREHLDTIRQEAERLHRVVNNLLDLARLRADALVPTTSSSPMDELIEGVINRLRPLLDGRPIELRIADDVPEIPMDVVQIDQVLTNLIENAIKFTPPGSPIRLSVVGANEVVRVTVSDRGSGIAKDDRTRIFEPFERGDASTTGTGLGLAIANAIVGAHGGRMWVSDNPAGGAAFTFELPSDPGTREEVDDARTRADR